MSKEGLFANETFKKCHSWRPEAPAPPIRNCCTPVEDIENNEMYDFSETSSVPFQSEKSTSYFFKPEKKLDMTSKRSVQNNEFFDNNSQKYVSNELLNVKLKKTGLSFGQEKQQKVPGATNNTPEAYDEFSETDCDQPMNFASCYHEDQIDQERSGSHHYSKNDFTYIEETADEEKVGTSKSKGTLSKEPKIKKEMFSNTSRSFREIFNFFKDRDKKRLNDNSKITLQSSQKLVKTSEIRESETDATSLSTDHLEEAMKLKNESQYSQQTPLMFSRCSSLSSLSGLENNFINDDKSSVISDFSRRTSEVVSPSELPDSPAQFTCLSNKSQSKSSVNCFGKKKNLFPPEKNKVPSGSFISNESQSDSLKRLPVAKLSVFEDNLTTFKDESTPTKLHSMAASSLSSLTIDDDDDFEILNKMILNKDKPVLSKEPKIEVEISKETSKAKVPMKDPQRVEIEVSGKENEDLSKEKEDELTDLTPYEEQILDQCIRKGISKWIKRNTNEIRPFSWDLGITCRATKSLLTSKLRIALYSDLLGDKSTKKQNHEAFVTNTNNMKDVKLSQIEDTIDEELEYHLKRDSKTNLNHEFYEKISDNYITYEEYLLDQCIRKGMAKITKRPMSDFKPFSWDVNGICLTTRALILKSKTYRSGF